MTREEEIRARLDAVQPYESPIPAVVAELAQLHDRADDLARRDADTRAMLNEMRDRLDALAKDASEAKAAIYKLAGQVARVELGARDDALAPARDAGEVVEAAREALDSVNDGPAHARLRAALSAYDSAPAVRSVGTLSDDLTAAAQAVSDAALSAPETGAGGEVEWEEGPNGVHVAKVRGKQIGTVFAAHPPVRIWLRNAIHMAEERGEVAPDDVDGAKAAVEASFRSALARLTGGAGVGLPSREAIFAAIRSEGCASAELSDVHAPCNGSLQSPFGPCDCWSAAGKVLALLSAAPSPAVEGDKGASRDGWNLVDHLRHQREWSRETFGPGARTKGVIDHIRKELGEIEADPNDITEWVDVIILAFDGAWRAGWEPEAIVAAIRAKQAKNEARVWPDWRKMSPDHAIEHDRSHDAPSSLPSSTKGGEDA